MVSVIIPTLNEEKLLPRCLDALLPPARESGAEVLVVDGGSSDDTRKLARDRSGLRLLDCAPGRGRQMNAGAREAAGTLLVFLPADTVLPPAALPSLCAIDAAGTPRAGGFRQRFDRPHPMLRAISFLHNLRATVTGVVYGDQVPFVRTSLFTEAGGYREDMHLEDVEFGSRLKGRTRSRLLDLTAVTSARRFEHAGAFRATLTAALILASWTFRRKVPSSDTFFSPVR